MSLVCAFMMTSLNKGDMSMPMVRYWMIRWNNARLACCWSFVGFAFAACARSAADISASSFPRRDSDIATCRTAARRERRAGRSGQAAARISVHHHTSPLFTLRAQR
jgi:hypothetical protein